MGKTKIKKVEAEEMQDANPVIAIPSAAEGEAISDSEITTSPATKAQDSSGSKEKKAKKSKKSNKAPKVRSKKYQEALEKVDRSKKYPLSEAVELAQTTSLTKFPGTVEAHLNTAAKNLRGLVSLPFVSGKSLKVLAFGKGAESSGADIVGTEETISEIDKTKSISFDVVVTTPDWMPKLAKIARLLGPRGLMPNPKNGTITENLEKAVTDLKGGKTEFKTEKDGKAIHLPVGKTDQSKEEIEANIKALYNGIGKSKIKTITLSSTMGPGIKVNLSSI